MCSCPFHRAKARCYHESPGKIRHRKGGGVMEMVSFTQVGISVGVVMVLGGLALLAKKIFLGDPPWATKQDMEKADTVLHKRIDKVADERRVSVANLHEKIDENTKATSEMKGELRLINQSLAGLSRDFSTWLQNQAAKKTGS